MSCRLLAVLLVLAITGPWACSQPPEVQTPDLRGSFPLGVYWPWERTQGMANNCGMEKWAFVDRCLDDLRAHHCDAVWAVNLNIEDLRPLADRCAARGIRLVPALAELHYNVDWRRNNWEYLEAESERALAAAGDSEAILAWALCDEPTAPLVDEMEAFRRKFHEWGADQPAVVVTMWPDSPIYAEKTGFPVVCTDIYPFFSAGNPNGPNTPGSSRNWYRRHCEVAVTAAARYHKTPWVMPQAYHEVWGPWRYDAGEAQMLPGAILHWRPPTVGEMRWQVWSAVACGVRGFFWFCYLPEPNDHAGADPYIGPIFPPELAVKELTPLGFSGALLRPDGAPTSQYEAVADALAALIPLIPLLTGAMPAQTTFGEVPAPGWLGTWHNPTLDRTFAVLVNDDTDNTRALQVWLTRPVDVIDLRTGALLPRAADNTVSITLGPGDGTILQEASPPGQG